MVVEGGKRWEAGGRTPSRYLQKFSGKVGEYLGAAAREVDIVFNANSAPAGFVDARLDRHDGARTKRCFGRLRETRCFVHLETEAVTQAVAKRIAIALVFDVTARQSIRLLALHAGPNRIRGNSVGMAHDLVYLFL